MNSGGKGRGRLFEILSQVSSSSGVNSGNTEEEQANGQFVAPASDSGISSDSKGTGRQRLLHLLSEQSDASTSTSTLSVPRGGLGRAKLLEDCARSLSHFKQLDISENESDSVDSSGRTTISAVSEESTEPEVIHRVGTSGREIEILTNYIPLLCNAEQGIYVYDVRFQPNIHSNQIRHQLLNKHRDILGRAKTFDGTILYLPKKLSQNIIKLKSTNESDQIDIDITVTYRRKKRMADSTAFYNVLIHRIMKVLEYVQFGKKQFDPSEPKIIPQHKLMVWPGFVTAIDEFEGGLMLMVDVSHRVLCETTVYDLLRRIHNSSSQNSGQNFKNTVQESLIGSVVLTRYNNKTYRIDDIDFDSNPMSTFKTKDRDITYIEYYKQHYNVDIKDLRQPLLVSRKERRVSGKEEKETMTFGIIPELCYLTGITDELRNDYKVLRDIATHTRVTPNQRTQALQQFTRRINGTPEAKQILADWGLALDSNPLELRARQLNEEKIEFGNNKIVSAGPNADFSKFATSNHALEVINITNWIVLCTKEYKSIGNKYLDLMVRSSTPMGIEVVRPNLIILNDDKTETYVRTLRNSITKDTQIVVAICPTSRDDRYAAIKKVCCSEIPVPSQVINAHTLKNDSKNRSIVQKIALQMNCKLGGSLWSIKIPFDDVMICGMDTYHDPSKKMNSVAAFVASINKTFTKWYSKATIQHSREELMHGLTISMQGALSMYQRHNLNSLPTRIIVFRDGVGDGQLPLCKEYEIPQLKAACRLLYENYDPQITFLVVQKRINTRIYKVTGPNQYENPDPGCIVDHTITRRFLYDFYLVAQNVRMGTVTPTHFVVVQDEANFKPDILQRLSYKLCFLYYNWPGTIRVPACCQYAHKMAYLVGQSIKRETAEKLADKLFYL